MLRLLRKIRDRLRARKEARRWARFKAMQAEKWASIRKNQEAAIKDFEDALWACPRCGHVDCPGPASCLSEH